ncbi:DNA (cytosine-5-)-methyltransferase [Marinococcus luteus]|uniref:DNA (cytosine-5-)-methyltransferase n=1 Tax=Marinococcus luteus TaxID=1122204 RepID=UPI002ACC9B5C|nr:DNA (cytosine-5-)-methyltransferase [Marinococcus luteus]MDZ5781891.1 DNA (cytosine-5-)-methyltransferase [Marinococcus luteus]
MVKVEERGRGKFKPAPEYKQEEVKAVLLDRINKERELHIEDELDYDIEKLEYKSQKANVISLFSGAGGLDLGLELAGLDVKLGKDEVNQVFSNKTLFDEVREESVFNHVYANDLFKEALETYNKNFNKGVFTHYKDIKKVAKIPNADIIVGGPPCPGYSSAGPRLVDDPRNFLYVHYIRALMQAQPKFFILENVKGMLNLAKGEVFKQIKEDFEATGYRIHYKLVNAKDYGIPQSRERVFLVGVREDIDFTYEFPEPTHGEGMLFKPYVTLREAISDLEDDPGQYFEGSYSTIFMSRNRKKSWEEPSFTIQASGRQAPLHPSGEPMKKVDKDQWIFPDGEENNRRLSVREIARIQTFPDWFEFSPEDTEKSTALDKKYKQIGNAVPVQLARVIAGPIAEWFYYNQIEEKSSTRNSGVPIMPETNVLLALKNILQQNMISLENTAYFKNKNRANSLGDLLEAFVKDAFCGESINVTEKKERENIHRQYFSYLGNSNNPPDFIIRDGPGVEVKKIEDSSETRSSYSQIALNSSHPKKFLYSDDSRITKECKECEKDNGGWEKKEMIYVIGNVYEEQISSLWFVYGDCFCAENSTYEQITERIKNEIRQINNINFEDTNELGKVKQIGPLNNSDLRIRGMWNIEHPAETFGEIVDDQPGINFYVLMRKDTFKKLDIPPDLEEFIKSEALNRKEVKIKEPDEPNEEFEAVLYSAVLNN